MATDTIEFVGCDLHYHADKPAFEKNPSTTESQTPRPVTINGKRHYSLIQGRGNEVVSIRADLPALGSVTREADEEIPGVYLP